MSCHICIRVVQEAVLLVALNNEVPGIAFWRKSTCHHFIHDVYSIQSAILFHKHFNTSICERISMYVDRIPRTSVVFLT